MTPFFVPGARAGVDTDRTYGELRAHAEQQPGTTVRATRIYALNARRDGADCETRVGSRIRVPGETVQAIFATAEGYTVIFEGRRIDLSKRQIYEAIPFD